MPPPTPDAIGGSRYRFVCDLGRGGMADVQLALQTSSAGVERLAVIKRVRPELATQAEFAAMFLEEARIAATLSHQNVVQTYEVGQDSQGYFLVLEFLRGQSYGEILSVAGYTDYRFSLEVLLGTLLGLEYAHQLTHLSGREMGLVHRDVSPPNVFVTYDGQIKVLDFGIAKALDSTVETDTGVIKGKVAYMSPEQMHGEPLDLRADLYAVGVMLWEATAGCRRFDGMPDVAVVSAVITQRAPLEPGAAEHGLPPLADAICARALAHDPRERYASAAEFSEDLLTLAELLGGRLPPRVLGQYVTELFPAEQAQLQQRIEAELERPTGSSNESSDGARAPAYSQPMTRVLPQRELAEALPLAAASGSSLSTAPGLQTDTSRVPGTSTSWKLRVAVAGVVLLGALYVAATKLASRFGPDHAVAEVASHRSAEAGPAAESTEPPMKDDPPSAASTIESAPSAEPPKAAASAPSAHSAPQAKPAKAKPVTATKAAAKLAGKRALPAPAASARVGLDRSNPWGP